MSQTKIITHFFCKASLAVNKITAVCMNIVTLRYHNMLVRHDGIQC